MGRRVTPAVSASPASGKRMGRNKKRAAVAPVAPQPVVPLPKLLYSRVEAATILGISARHLDALIRRGDILSFKPGKQRWVPMHVIEAYIEAHVA